MTIYEIKKKLSANLHINIDLIQLLYQGKITTDETPLYELGMDVSGGSTTLKLNVKMGLGAGGRMAQKIYEDAYTDRKVWDDSKMGTVFIHIADAAMWKAITGKAMPPTPVAASAYTRAGLPWFSVWDAAKKDIAVSKVLAGVVSVQEMVRVSPKQPEENMLIDICSELEEAAQETL